MIPIALYAVFRKKDELCNRLKRIFSISNILVPLMLLIVFGTYFAANGQASGGFEFTFLKTNVSAQRFLMNYLLFVLTEFGIYLIVLGNEASKQPFYKIMLTELLLFPLIMLKDVNFIMRGSIPALFILMIVVIHFLLQKRGEHEYHIRQMILTVLLIIGAATSFNEINRSISNTSNSNEVINRDIESFAYIDNGNEDEICVANDQFFVHNYENKFFFKYIAQ